MVVFRRGDLRQAVNVGPHTRPETFRFSGNWWYAEDGGDSRPQLPAVEQKGIYGVDPGLDPEGRPRHRRAGGVGVPCPSR